MKRFRPMRIVMGLILLPYCISVIAAIGTLKSSDLALMQGANQAQTIELEARLNQANALFKQGAYYQAIERYQAIIKAHPRLAIVHYNSGLAYLAIHKTDNAIDALTRATQIDPQYELAHYFLGYAYQTINQFETAIACYDQCMRINPYRYEAHLNKGRALANSGKVDAAIASYEEALHGYGYDANIHKEFGLLCTKGGDNEKALAHYRRAIALAPHTTELHYALAHHLYTTGNFDAAIPEYLVVLRNDSNHALAHAEAGACYIAGGNLQEGLMHRAWIQRTTRSRNEELLSQDDNLENKTIRIHAEKEVLTDLIQHARYIPLLKERGAYITLVIEQERAPLFSNNPFIDAVVSPDTTMTEQTVDYTCEIANIAHACKEYAPNTRAIPYLYTDPELDAYWKQQLSDDSSFKIGICFQSQKNERSPLLDHCGPLAQIPGISLYALHPLHHHAPLGLIPTNLPFKNIAHLYNDRYAHIAHQASLLKQMDLVITVDDTVGHLAGALGVTTWVLSSRFVDWHWSTRSGKTPWYPTVTIYTHDEPNNWQPTITHVLRDLERLLFNTPSTPQAAAPTATATQLIAEVSIGELIDKMTILEIKSERMKDPVKLRNVLNEYRILNEAFEKSIPREQRTKKLNSLKHKLKTVNEKLWDIEDNIRDKESKQEFDDQFITLARSVYFTNDRRGELKRKINDLLGSRLVEEKNYTRYK